MYTWAWCSARSVIGAVRCRCTHSGLPPSGPAPGPAPGPGPGSGPSAALPGCFLPHAVQSTPFRHWEGHKKKKKTPLRLYRVQLHHTKETWLTPYRLPALPRNRTRGASALHRNPAPATLQIQPGTLTKPLPPPHRLLLPHLSTIHHPPSTTLSRGCPEPDPLLSLSYSSSTSSSAASPLANLFEIASIPPIPALPSLWNNLFVRSNALQLSHRPT